MLIKRKLFQISLITLGLIIVFLTYFTNLEKNQQKDFKVSENTPDDERFLEEGVNRFENVEYQGIDNSGNYSFGIKEHIIFPEVNFDKVDKIRGLDITIVTSNNSKKGTFELLKEFNFPITEKMKR